MLLSGLESILSLNVDRHPAAVSQEEILTFQLEMATLNRELTNYAQLDSLLAFVRDNIANVQTLSLRALITADEERLVFGGLLAELPVETTTESIAERVKVVLKKTWAAIMAVINRIAEFYFLLIMRVWYELDKLYYKLKRYSKILMNVSTDTTVLLLVRKKDLLYTERTALAARTFGDWFTGAMDGVLAPTAQVGVTANYQHLMSEIDKHLQSFPEVTGDFYSAESEHDGYAGIDHSEAKAERLTLRDAGYSSARELISILDRMYVPLDKLNWRFEKNGTKRKLAGLTELLELIALEEPEHAEKLTNFCNKLKRAFSLCATATHFVLGSVGHINTMLDDSLAKL